MQIQLCSAWGVKGPFSPSAVPLHPDHDGGHQRLLFPQYHPGLWNLLGPPDRGGWGRSGTWLCATVCMRCESSSKKPLSLIRGVVLAAYFILWDLPDSKGKLACGKRSWLASRGQPFLSIKTNGSVPVQWGWWPHAKMKFWVHYRLHSSACTMLWFLVYHIGL